MENLVTNLHTAARRYCLDRISMWRREYGRLVERGAAVQGRAGTGNEHYCYTSAALGLFPRYDLLEAILHEVERFRPWDFASLVFARELLLMMGRSARTSFEEGRYGPVADAVAADERDAFCRMISGLSPGDLACVEPLFFRRVLSDSEVLRWRQALAGSWEVGEGYWYPLSGVERTDLLAFHADGFLAQVAVSRLREAIAGRGVSTALELREWGLSHELDILQIDPHYGGAEGFWFSEAMDWIIYASHEDSITVGGEWLLEELKRLWPEWQESLWPDAGK